MKNSNIEKKAYCGNCKYFAWPVDIYFKLKDDFKYMFKTDKRVRFDGGPLCVYKATYTIDYSPTFMYPNKTRVYVFEDPKKKNKDNNCEHFRKGKYHS